MFLKLCSSQDDATKKLGFTNFMVVLKPLIEIIAFNLKKSTSAFLQIREICTASTLNLREPWLAMTKNDLSRCSCWPSNNYN